MLSLDALSSTALRNWARANDMMSRYLRQLSTGLRINSAADDPAGLCMSEQMRSQIGGLRQASRNAQDAISLVQVAEGGVGQIGDVLQRMRELTVQAANDTLDPADRQAVQLEFDELVETIRGFAQTTEFNTTRLLDGSFTDKSFQVGANPGQDITLSIAAMTPEALGVTELSLGDHTSASAALEAVEGALGQVNGERAKLGAFENRLGYTIAGLEVTAENLQAAESRLRDADLAEAMMGFVKWQIQSRVALWVLSQINVQRSMVLKLLEG
jgi:flagellin